MKNMYQFFGALRFFKKSAPKTSDAALFLKKARQKLVMLRFFEIQIIIGVKCA